MTKPDLVTVIMPVYNGERFLDEAISSILNQTYTNIDFIIVNDGSTDNTDAIIQRYVEQQKNTRPIRYIKQVNSGKNRAVNNALQHAQGVYITILDHDDVFPVNSIERRVASFKNNPSLTAVYGDAALIDENSRLYGEKKSRQITRVEELIGFFKNPIASCSIMFTKEVSDKIGPFDEKIQRLDDVDRNISFLLAGPILYIPEVLLNFRTYKRILFFKLRIQSVTDFYIIINKYLKFPFSYYFLCKQMIFQFFKFVWECVTWRK